LAVTRKANNGGLNPAGLTTYGWDDAGRLTSVKHQDNTGNPLGLFTYGYDPAGLVKQAKEPGGLTHTYGYDRADQLTQVDSTHTSITALYGYDPAGNRNTNNYVPTVMNQLLRDSDWTSYGCDAEGNLVNKNKGSAEGWTYTYDNANHLTSAQHFLGGANPVEWVTYAYDALGQRVETQQTLQGGTTPTTHLAYDGQDVCADLSSTNTLMMRRLYTDQDDQVVARVGPGSSPTVAWYLPDGLGSVRNIVNVNSTQVLNHGKRTSSLV